MSDNSTVVITVPEDTELETFKQMYTWMLGLSEEQIDFVCDNGKYNDAINGYLIAAGENAGFSRDQIWALVRGLRQAFEDMSKKDAQQLWYDW